MQVEAKVYSALLDIINNAIREWKKIRPNDTQMKVQSYHICNKLRMERAHKNDGRVLIAIK